MTFFAVIDTNVLVSSLLTKHTDAAPAQIVQMILSGKIIVLYDDDILREYEEVLRRPKFRFSEELVASFIKIIRNLGLPIERTHVNDNFPDPKDIAFFEVCMTARASCDTYLVTGNKRHFPVRPYVVSPAEMVQIMERI